MGVRCEDGSEHDQSCRSAQEVRGPPRRGRCPRRRVRACRSDPRPVKLNLPLEFHNCLATDLLSLFLTILAILGLIPNGMSLAQGFRLREHVRRGMRLAFGGLLPPALVIPPGRRLDPGVDENVRALPRPGDSDVLGSGPHGMERGERERVVRPAPRVCLGWLVCGAPRTPAGPETRGPMAGGAERRLGPLAGRAGCGPQDRVCPRGPRPDV